MAHFARLDETNKVIGVEVVVNEVLTDANGDEQEQLGIDFLTKLNGGVGWYKQTSYNGTFRKNFAGIGFTYDSSNNVFIEPYPGVPWVLNEATYKYELPVMYPIGPGDENGVLTSSYIWDEETTNWLEVTE